MALEVINPPFWPTTLPQKPLLQSFSDTIPDGRVLTKMSSGVGQRRAFWAGIRTLTVSMILTPDQWETLAGFWQQTLQQGIQPFWIEDTLLFDSPMITDGSNDGTAFYLTNEVGLPLFIEAYNLVQFGSTPPQLKEAMSTQYLSVTMSIEVLPQ